jgi:hypothetical protein
MNRTNMSKQVTTPGVKKINIKKKKKKIPYKKKKA